jgi:putative nucleotidyltransferase with HDIG domain
VLRELAGRLRSMCRESDVLARYGGQQFAVALFETRSDQAVALARRIRELVANCQLRHGEEAIQISVCIGIGGCVPGFIESTSELIERAQQALAEAKKRETGAIVSWEGLSNSQASPQPEQDSLEDMKSQFDRLNQQLRKSYIESTLALVAAVEAKDPHTKRHSLNVATYAASLARQLGLEAIEIEALETAAILHDIGKIGIPDHILTKPDALTDEELALVRRHTVMAVQILQHVSFLKTELPIILHHHERWDGSGYPEGLAGTSIPLGARILHVADSIEAMLATRSYKTSYPIERVIGELKAGSGTQFDPAVCVAAVEWLEANAKNVLAAIESDSVTDAPGDDALLAAGSARPSTRTRTPPAVPVEQAPTR